MCDVMSFELKCDQNGHKREVLLKYYDAHKRPSLNSVLSRMNPVEYLLNFRYYIVPKKTSVSALAFIIFAPFSFFR
jgi:hypothetical protein